MQAHTKALGDLLVLFSEGLDEKTTVVASGKSRQRLCEALLLKLQSYHRRFPN